MTFRQVVALADVPALPNGTDPTNASIPINLAGTDYLASRTALLNGIDTTTATVLSSLPATGNVLFLTSANAIALLPVGLLPAGGSTGPATTFVTSLSATSVVSGSPVTVTYTPGTGGWPSNEVVTPSASGLTGAFDAANKTGNGTTPVTFTYTPSATGSGTITATAPGMTANSPQALTVTATAASTFTVAASPSNIATGATSTLTVTPGSGGWPSGKVVTAVATTVTGSFDAATKTGSGTTPVTFTFTASGGAASGSLSATAPGMTLSGSAAPLTTTSGSTYPSMTLTSPAFATGKYGSALSGGTGVSQSVSLAAAGRLSIGFWFQATGNSYCTVLQIPGLVDFGLSFGAFEGSVGGTAPGSTPNSGNSGTPNASDGTWHWCYFEVNGGTVNSYMDGGGPYAPTNGSSTTATSAVVNVGPAYATNGMIDELMVWSDIVNTRKAAPTTALTRTSTTLLYLPFDGNGTGS